MAHVPPLAQLLTAFDDEARFGTLETDRLQIRYSDWGAGQPIIFVHGLAERACAFAPIMYRLRDRFRCIALELANGKDDGAAIGGFGLYHYADDVGILCDHLRLDRPMIFGASFGSVVTLQAMLQMKGRFVAGVLQGAFARRPLSRPERLLATVAQFFPGRMAHMPGREKVMDKNDVPQFAGAEPGMYEFFLANTRATPIRAAARRGIILDRTDLRSRLGEITVPIAMVGGNADLLVPKPCELELLNGLPNATRLELNPCGHYAPYTHPGECAAEIIRLARTLELIPHE